jgi:hypothetical protein
MQMSWEKEYFTKFDVAREFYHKFECNIHDEKWLALPYSISIFAIVFLATAWPHVINKAIYDVSSHCYMAAWPTINLNYSTIYRETKAATYSLKPGFHMVVTVVKIESRSLSSAEIVKYNILELKKRGVIRTKEYLWFVCGLQV